MKRAHLAETLATGGTVRDAGISTGHRRPHQHRRGHVSGLAPAMIEPLESRQLLSLAMVADINPGTAEGVKFDSGVVIGNTLFFAGQDIHGWELWRSDGTAAGTSMVKDINPAGDGFDEDQDIAPIGNLLYFTAFDGADTQLWRSDGTAAGTYAVTSGAAGVRDVQGLMAYNGLVYFTSNASGYRVLWRSDGTAAGTTRLSDISPGSTEGAKPLGGSNGRLFFSQDGVTMQGAGTQLWSTDGTAAGTQLVSTQVFASVARTWGPNSGSVLLFTADDGVHGREMWRSDGTAAGTYLLKDINPGGGSLDGAINAPWVNGAALFEANDGVSGRELWRTDGTAAGTYMVKDIYPGPGDGEFHPFGLLGNQLLFYSNDGTHGGELWRSDGTAAGTYLVKDIMPGAEDSSPGMWGVVLRGRMYFGARDGVHGWSLWASDGTEAGTYMDCDLAPGSADFAFFPMGATDNTIFMAADDGVHDYELWRYAPPVVSRSGLNGAIAVQPYFLSFSSFDPWPSTVTGWSVNWGDGQVQTFAAGTTSSLHYYATPGTYTVTATMTNGEGPYSAAPMSVRVYAKGATVTGTLYNDANANGKREKREAGLPKCAVFVDYNANGVKDFGEPSGMTNKAGKYTIRGVLPGASYVVHAASRAGFRRCVSPLFMAPGEVIVGKLDAAMTQLAQVSGSVFADNDGNGVRDMSEAGIAKVRVFADLNGNGKWERSEPSARTDALGNYAMNVPAGVRLICIQTPKKQHATVPADGKIRMRVRNAKVYAGRSFGVQR